MTGRHDQFTTINPSTGEKLVDYSYANNQQIDKVLETLHRGFLKWRKLSVKDRQNNLTCVVQKMQSLKNEFVQQITVSMGKPIIQAQAEFEKSVEAALYLCEQDWDLLNPKTIVDLNRQHEIRREPMGVILGVMPWNFPLWQAVRMIFPALISGNVVFLKHAEITASVGELIEKCFEEINLQHNILKHELFGHEKTERIISDRRVGGVSLTGSIRAGRTIGELSGRHLKKAVLELGGSDPSLVFSDCDLDQTAQAILKSRFSNTGQVCIATKRVFVERTFIKAFLQKAVGFFANYQPDDPLKKTTQIGPLAHTKFKAEFNQHIEFLRRRSEVIAENKSNLTSTESAFVNPQILLFSEHLEFFKDHEIFGPALCVFPFDSESEALNLANSTIFGLGASVYTSNRKRILEFSNQLCAGQIAINSGVASNVKLPFGGMNQSGLGREMGEDGFLEFTQTKVVSRALEPS